MGPFTTQSCSSPSFPTLGETATRIHRKFLVGVLCNRLIPSQTATTRSKFDNAYFSGSISLLPDQTDALLAVASLVKKGGRIYVTQTYQHLSFPGLAFLKRNMKYLTTIDFGELMFERDILEVFDKCSKGER